MSDEAYKACKYSVTCQTDDLAIVSCLRALCQHNARMKNPQISWGGTKKKEWESAGNCVTFRFISPDRRDSFLIDAKRILPHKIWNVVNFSDNNPATRQRDPH